MNTFHCSMIVQYFLCEWSCCHGSHVSSVWIWLLFEFDLFVKALGYELENFSLHCRTLLLKSKQKRSQISHDNTLPYLKFTARDSEDEARRDWQRLAKIFPCSSFPYFFKKKYIKIKSMWKSKNSFSLNVSDRRRIGKGYKSDKNQINK